MKKKFVSRVIWMSLVGVAFFAFQLPSIMYGEAPEVIDDILLPRFTPTPLPPEMVLTQQAFALMFFTPTYTPEPTQPFLAFLLPITGPTETLTPTASITNTATRSATPTRTLLPVFRTQTEAYEGGGGGGGGGIFTSTPFRTSTPVINPSSAASSTPGLPTATDEPPATATVEPETNTPEPTRPPNTHRPPTNPPEPDTETPVPPPDTPVPPPDTPVPPPDTPVPPPDTPDPGGNSEPGNTSTASGNLMQFVFLYGLGATFLGVVFRRR